MRSLVLLAAALALAAAAPPSALAEGSFAGRWKIVLDRPGLEPREEKGILVLEPGKTAWKGSVTFETLGGGKRQDLIDLKVDAGKIEFKVAALGYWFKGEKSGGSFSGTCDTTRGHQYAWTAGEDRIVPAELFDDNLPPQGALPRGDAKGMGLDPSALYDLVREAEAAESDSLVILRRGKAVCERTFGRDPGPVPLGSATQAVTVLGVLFLLEDGKIESLDAPLSTWLQGWKDGYRGQVTLRHVLTHTSGIAQPESPEALDAEADRVAFATKAEVADPGKAWEENDTAVALLAGILARAAGKSCDQHVANRLFDPLGIKAWKWERDASGRTVAYSGLSLTGRDLARVGQFVADGGKAGTKPILGERFVAYLGSEATPVHKAQGLLWTRIVADGECVGLRAEGGGGQHLVVFPRQGLVGVRLRRGAKSDGAVKEFAAFPQRLRACLVK